MVDSKPSFESKFCSPEELVARCQVLPRPLVFSNGCFDVLHRGHVTYLDQSAAMGKTLVLALNTDASVRRLGKGSERPINSLSDRMAVVAALNCVDLVTYFDDDTPLSLILRCQPEVLTKGGDWSLDQIVGAQEVLARGGQVRSIAFVHQRSTTQLVSKIQSTLNPGETTC